MGMREQNQSWLLQILFLALLLSEMYTSYSVPALSFSEDVSFLQNSAVPCLLMNRAVNSPQDGIYPSWLSGDCWRCINTTLGVTVVQVISHSSPRVLGRAGVERRGSGWPHSFLSASSKPHGCFCSETSAGTCAPVGCLAEVSGLGLYKATQPLCLPNAVQSRSQPGLGFVAGLGACKAKDSGFGLHLSVYLYNDRKSKFLTSKYESKQKHCEGQLSTAERWCYPSHTFNS